MTSFMVAAAPEGRECVVVLGAKVASEAEHETIEHILDTFEVDFGLLTSHTGVPKAFMASASSPSPSLLHPTTLFPASSFWLERPPGRALGRRPTRGDPG